MITQSLLYLALALVSFSGISWFLGKLYIFLRPEKTKDVLAYHFLKASDFSQAYLAEQDQRAKKSFLGKCLTHIRKAEELLESTLDSARISLDLPDLKQLKMLQNNIMHRIYPYVQEGRNTSDDILMSLSEIFFYENEYDRLPTLNAAIEQSLQFRSYETGGWHVPARLRQSITFRCAIGIILIVAIILACTYILRSPTEPTEYWQYVKQNAATITAAIVASSVAISVFIWSKKKSGTPSIPNEVQEVELNGNE
jgi:hypothetical protein